MRPSGHEPFVGEGFAGEGANAAHVNIVLGHRTGDIQKLMGADPVFAALSEAFDSVRERTEYA